MTRIFPMMIILIVVALAGPVAVDWVAGLTVDLAADTATQMQELSK